MNGIDRKSEMKRIVNNGNQLVGRRRGSNLFYGHQLKVMMDTQPSREELHAIESPEAKQSRSLGSSSIADRMSRMPQVTVSNGDCDTSKCLGRARCHSNQH